MLKRKLLAFSLFSTLFLTSCGEHWDSLLECDDVECVIEEGLSILERTGWLADKEDFDNIPEDIDIDTLDNGLPRAKSLENKFPPIGDQGSYGTCVAWATGYNLKTALNAIDKGWSSTQLNSTANQTSPKDLWFIIKSSDKGSNCNGTNFEPAMDALISKGAASLSSVPYTNMGNCSGSSNGNSSNKLGDYRKIASNAALAGGSGSAVGMNVNNFKNYLAQGRPVLIGAKLGDRFMSWKDASVIRNDTYRDPGMQHAYHAMVLVGYDDSKNAFRVRNSWGEGWGDKGSIWVEYDFFLTSFGFAAFVAENPKSSASAQIMEKQLPTGYDLLVASVEDFLPDASSPLKRAFSYKAYNSGKETILDNQKWTVLYMYYNAFNAKDFGVIYKDDYAGESILSGKDGLYISYEMPKITGKYYLVVYADAYDEIQEGDEDNNFYFFGAEDGKPLEFKNGIMMDSPVFAKKASSVQEIGGNPNAYTPEEIKKLVLRNKKKSGAAN